MSQLDKDWQWELEPSHRLLTWDDPSYPKLLKEIHYHRRFYMSVAI